MSFFRSIFTVLAAVLAMGFPYFVGYGLALHETLPMIYGAGFLVASAVVFALLARGKGERGPAEHPVH